MISEKIRESVMNAFIDYQHCNIVNRDMIADILSLSRNEKEIMSIDNLSAAQRNEIKQKTKARRVLFGSLSQERDGLLVTLNITNLETTLSEDGLQFVIPNNEYETLEMRSRHVKKAISALIEGKKNTPIESSANPLPGIHKTENKTPIVVDAESNKYKTIEFNDKYWLASNLNLETENSWCYNNTTGHCMNYGRLYTWEAAKRACASLGDGWRLPSDQEWKDLAASQHGYFMVQPDLSQKKVGDDPTLTYSKLLKGGSSRFEALLAGRRDEFNKFNEFENIGFFWTSTPFDNNLSWAWMLMKVNPLDGVIAHSTGPWPWFKTNGHSCRCIKDK